MSKTGSPLNNTVQYSDARLITIIAPVLVAAIGCAYWRAFLVGFLSDDHLMLAFASVAPLDIGVLAPQSERWLFFHRPLPLLLWQMMYRIWGFNPLPYHLLSIILHTANSILLVCLVLLISPRNSLAATGAGLAFAVFPLNVEAVIWLSCWFDLVALVFYVCTLIALILAWQRGRFTWYMLSLGAYQLALWSKESAFTLPAVALAAGMLLEPRPRLKMLAVSLVPYSALLSINLFQRYLAWGSFGGYASASASQLSPTHIKVASTFFTFIAPLNRSVFPLSIVIIVAFTMLCLLFAGLVIRKQLRLALFGLLWISLTLIPVFSLLPVAPDLQGARLLYPVTSGYAIILSVAITNLLVRSASSRNNVLKFSLITGLLFAGIASIQLQTQPWIVATRASETILAELRQALPRARLGTILQVVHPPDTYRGAYILRLGADASMIAQSGEIFIQWPEYSAGPIPYEALNLTSDFYQVTVRGDEQQQTWGLAQVRGVTFPGTLPEFPRSHWIYAMNGDSLVEKLATQAIAERPIIEQWSFENCDEVEQLQAINAVLKCDQEAGLVIAPTGDDPMVTIPISNIRTDRWTQVEVSLQALSPVDQGYAQIFWGGEGESLAEERSLAIELPGTPQLLHYQFFIPPYEEGARLATLRLDPINQQVPIRMTAVRIRQDP